MLGWLLANPVFSSRISFVMGLCGRFHVLEILGRTLCPEGRFAHGSK